MTELRSRHSRRYSTPSSAAPTSTPQEEPVETQEDASSEVEEQLNLARVSRSQAESARQKIANEILEATKEVCQKLIDDGEQTLARAKSLEVQAQQKHAEAAKHLDESTIARSEADAYAKKTRADAEQHAQKKLDQAQNTRVEADAYRDKLLAEVQEQVQGELDQAQKVRDEADSYRDRVMTDAEEQAQEILRNARAEAEKESSNLKRRASEQAQKTIEEAEVIKAATAEELEAQRIYVEAARLEAESREVLAQVRSRILEQTEVETATEVSEEPPAYQTSDTTAAAPEASAEEGAPVAKKSPARKKPASTQTRGPKAKS